MNGKSTFIVATKTVAQLKNMASQELSPPDQIVYEFVSELTKRVTLRILGSFPR